MPKILSKKINEFWITVFSIAGLSVVWVWIFSEILKAMAH